ncbi:MULTISPECIES: hypothetical protein [Bacillus]|uniref:Indoleamine 2,3-dioxygenase n=2 Tax=Bacillus cereus group TaxID=86661 RepID=R8CJS4_BACCE|nr:MULTISPECIES: hypothetical protein [Bacillus]EOO11869.1 hypothetical protein IGA_05253 [Bacillus cereus HuA3-9]RBP25733.1 indoleamine 2,3-dioxygenase [Bacillus sp. DB-2]REF18383.1 indoleamine 2,3-dioxygenase [Bacillus mycoides]
MSKAFNELDIQKLDKYSHGFLPNTTPLQLHQLPNYLSEFDILANQCIQELHYLGARNLVKEFFAKHKKLFDVNNVKSLNNYELNNLSTRLAIIFHSFRWDTIPPKSGEYARKTLDIPEYCLEYWQYINEKLGMPPVGTLHNLMLYNWKVDNIGSNQIYNIENVIKGEGLQPIFCWATEEHREHHKNFSMTIVRMEAIGASIFPVIKNVILSGLTTESITILLDELHKIVINITKMFASTLKKGSFSGESFLSSIQPFMIWGLASKSGKILTGASGPMSPIVHIVDAILQISGKSSMRILLQESRMYMTYEQRSIIELIEKLAKEIQPIIVTNEELINKFNVCIDTVKRWRIMHKSRAVFTLSEKNIPQKEYLSTGMTIEGEDRLQQLRIQLDEIIEETSTSRLYHL